MPRPTATKMLQRLLADTDIRSQYRLLRNWEADAHNEALDCALAAVRKTASADDLQRITADIEFFRMQKPFAERSK